MSTAWYRFCGLRRLVLPATPALLGLSPEEIRWERYGDMEALVGWIPEIYAELGKILIISGEDGWEVTSVGEDSFQGGPGILVLDVRPSLYERKDLTNPGS